MPDLELVRAMKARAVEHVRWRRVEAPRDFHAVARITVTRAAVIEKVKERHQRGNPTPDTWQMFSALVATLPGYLRQALQLVGRARLCQLHCSASAVALEAPGLCEGALVGA